MMLLLYLQSQTPGVLVVRWLKCALVQLRMWRKFFFEVISDQQLLIRDYLFCRWAGLSAEEIYRAVVKDRRLPPQYAHVVGVGIPTELWKMIGDCLQFKATRRPTFHAMLAVFLRHLQEIPHSPPESPKKYEIPSGLCCDILLLKSSPHLLHTSAKNSKVKQHRIK
ncbi:hypothetical protein CsSME_00042161 [Camellia sinensis var. sinensis]